MATQVILRDPDVQTYVQIEFNDFESELHLSSEKGKVVIDGRFLRQFTAALRQITEDVDRD